jgi:hypothetical protein
LFHIRHLLILPVEILLYSTGKYNTAAFGKTSAGGLKPLPARIQPQSATLGPVALVWDGYNSPLQGP